MTFTIPRPDWVSDRLVAERGENAGFQMYTRAGNDVLAAAILMFAEDVNTRVMRRAEALDILKRSIAVVAGTYPEVHDTEPEWAVVDAVNALFDTQGWVHIDREVLF